MEKKKEDRRMCEYVTESVCGILGRSTNQKFKKLCCELLNVESSHQGDDSTKHLQKKISQKLNAICDGKRSQKRKKNTPSINPVAAATTSKQIKIYHAERTPKMQINEDSAANWLAKASQSFGRSNEENIMGHNQAIQSYSNPLKERNSNWLAMPFSQLQHQIKNYAGEKTPMKQINENSANNWLVKASQSLGKKNQETIGNHEAMQSYSQPLKERNSNWLPMPLPQLQPPISDFGAHTDRFRGNEVDHVRRALFFDEEEFSYFS